MCVTETCHFPLCVRVRCLYLAKHPLHAIILLIEMLVHSVGDHQSEALPGEAVVNSAVMDGAAALHQALAGETFLEKERRLSEMIRQLQMVREQLLSQQELQGKVGRDISLQYIKKNVRGFSDINPSNAELNPIRHLLALVGARHIVHVSRIRVNRCSVRKQNTGEISVG